MTTATHSRSLWPETKDHWAVGAFAILTLGLMAPMLGVWEPWEADAASVVQNMISTGQWLTVSVGGDDAPKNISELPFGFWPIAASTMVFGVNEIGLRLPGILLSAGVLMLLFSTTRRLTDRWTAWLAVSMLLMLPLFSFHSRFALGHGTAMMFCGLASLSFIRARLNSDCKTWLWIAWLTTALAGLCGGVPALLVPILTALIATATPNREDEEERSWTAMLPVAPITVMCVLVGLGWWRASVYRPENAPIETLLLWANSLGEAGKAADRPSFNHFFHQIGFGLFPLGAILPLAVVDLVWRDDEDPLPKWLGPALTIWVASAFLGPALGASYSHFGFFLGAPAVAIIMAIYFNRMVTGPARPVYALATVMLVALLDSNLKHETRLLADTLVGQKIDSFPASLGYWKLARWLDFALLGFVLVYQGHAFRALGRYARSVFYPKVSLRLLDWRGALAALIIPLLLWMKTTTLNPIVLHPLWRKVGMVVTARRVVVGLVAWLIAYFILRALWNWRVRFVAERTEGKTTELLEAIYTWFHEREWGGFKISRLGLALIVGLWIVFMNGAVTASLTTNFSQKELLNRFRSLANENEEIFKYRVSERNSSFYARDLTVLKRGEFTQKAKEASRFFVIIPRKELASINNSFRRAAGRTLPILDDSGSRFLLASNTLKDGEQDRNPITRALLKELPADAKRVEINFEDKIELVGWKVEPTQPRPGSPAKLHMFWRSKVDHPGNWKVFVHIDATGQRIHGDHDPVEGLFPTQNWKKGDLIQDVHLINVKRTITPARFTFNAGLYRGKKRMKITKGSKDGENRARLGSIEVR